MEKLSKIGAFNIVRYCINTREYHFSLDEALRVVNDHVLSLHLGVFFQMNSRHTRRLSALRSSLYQKLYELELENAGR